MEGYEKCPFSGTVIFKWDNAYSVIRGKNLSINVDVVKSTTIHSAMEAATSLKHAVENNNLSGNLITSGSTEESINNNKAYTHLINDLSTRLVSRTVSVACQAASSILDTQTLSRNACKPCYPLSILPKDVADIDNERSDLRTFNDCNLISLKNQSNMSLAEIETLRYENRILKEDIKRIQKELNRRDREVKAYRRMQEDRDPLIFDINKNVNENETIAFQAKEKVNFNEEKRHLQQEIHELKNQLSKLTREKGILISGMREAEKSIEEYRYAYEAKLIEAKAFNRQLQGKYENLRCFIEDKLHNNMRSDAIMNEKIKTEIPKHTMINSLTKYDMAILNGECRLASSVSISKNSVKYSHIRAENGNPNYRKQLYDFFSLHDPGKINQIDYLLECYNGVEDSLMDSLRLKYDAL